MVSKVWNALVTRADRHQSSRGSSITLPKSCSLSIIAMYSHPRVFTRSASTSRYRVLTRTFRTALLTLPQAEVVEPTRWLCGVCISSTTNIGTNLNGSHLMAWSGQFLSGREEQRYLLNFLEQFGHKTKWPNETSCGRLQRAWQHSRKSWTEC